MKKNQNQIEMLDFKSVNLQIDVKVDNLQNIYLKEKQYIENKFKKEKESYLKDVKEKNENITQLKELNQKIETDVYEYMQQVKVLKEKNSESEKKIKLTEDIRNHFYEELKKQNQMTIKNF